VLSAMRSEAACFVFTNPEANRLWGGMTSRVATRAWDASVAVRSGSVATHKLSSAVIVLGKVSSAYYLTTGDSRSGDGDSRSWFVSAALLAVTSLCLATTFCVQGN
jgi:hypothetical protein